MKLEEAYSVLEVQVGAQEDEVKKAYRRLALLHHPDKNQGDEGAKQRFQRVSAAFKRITTAENDSSEDDDGYDDEGYMPEEELFQV